MDLELALLVDMVGVEDLERQEASVEVEAVTAAALEAAEVTDPDLEQGLVEAMEDLLPRQLLRASRSL